MKRFFLAVATVCSLFFYQITSAGMSFDDTQEAALNFYYQQHQSSKGFALTFPLLLNDRAYSGRPMELNDFPNFKVAIEQSNQGLAIEFYNKMTGKLIASMRYPTAFYLENTFQTQGFTGLQYIHHPDGSVLQFIGMVK